MKLKDLFAGIETIYVSADWETEIPFICYDSRKVSRDCLFVCLRGRERDGHSFAKDAADAGAIIVAEEPCGTMREIIVADTRTVLAEISAVWFGRPTENLKLIGVTGTNGKTTTTYLLKALLEAQGKRVGLIGTIQNMVGDKVLPTIYTTPEPLELHGIFRRMADEGAEYVVMEVSSQALHQRRVEGLRFAAAVFTNLTQDHLDYHHTMEEYLAAKAILFRQADISILNLDDEASEKLRKEAAGAVITYGLENGRADVFARNLTLYADRVEMEVVTRKKFRVRKPGEKEAADEKSAADSLEKDYRWACLHIPGRFSAYNGLGVLTCMMALGIDKEAAINALSAAGGVPGRAEVVPCQTDFTVLIDYAHSPDSLRNILRTARGFARGRVVVLFGCGGNRDRSKRPLMGGIAAELADFAVVTSDNCRLEKPADIIAEILPGFAGSGTPHIVIENRADAIRWAIDHAEPGDIIVLAGKGHERYEIVGEERLPFDERMIVRDAVENRKK